MHRFNWTRSIAPLGGDQDYIVVDDFGRIGRSYRETDVETADLETTITDMLAGECSNPVRLIAFNTAEQWSEDASEDVANEIRRGDLQLRDVPSSLEGFVDRHEDNDRQLTLRLA